MARGRPFEHYAAGLGLPFLLAALGVSRFLLVSAAVKKHMKWVERSAGVLLVGTGLLIMLGTLQSLATYLLDWFPALGNWVKTGFMIRPFATIPAGALVLGVAGLIPFVTGGVLVWLPQLQNIAPTIPPLVFFYAALIVSFLGGVRWGAAMQNATTGTMLHANYAPVSSLRSSLWSVTFFHCRQH